MQREKPGVTMEQFEATFGQRPVYASGGQIENFREGWAHNIMGSGQIAHYYMRMAGFDKVVTKCGGRPVKVRWIYGAGNYPKCKTCQKMKKEKNT